MDELASPKQEAEGQTTCSLPIFSAPNHAQCIKKNSYNPILIQSTHSRQSLRGIALVGLDSLAAGELLISVSRVDDLLLVGDGESGEAGVGAELAGPARGDGVRAAGDRVVVGAAGGLASDVVGALLDGGAVVAVDAERDVARGVSLVAGAREVGDGPLRGDGSHELRLEVGGSGDGRGGGGKGAEEESSELHFGDLVVGCLWVRIDALEGMRSCDDDGKESLWSDGRWVYIFEGGKGREGYEVCAGML